MLIPNLFPITFDKKIHNSPKLDVSLMGHNTCRFQYLTEGLGSTPHRTIRVVLLIHDISGPACNKVSKPVLLVHVPSSATRTHFTEPRQWCSWFTTRQVLLFSSSDSQASSATGACNQ